MIGAGAVGGSVPGVLDVGRHPRGVDEVTERIADGLGAAGYSSRAVTDVMPWKYRKLLVNLANAAEAACGPDDPGLRDLLRVARSEGERRRRPPPRRRLPELPRGG